MGTIGELSLVIIDIAALLAILYHTWGLRRGLFRSNPEEERSIASLFLRQGVFRFFIISVWSLADALVFKFARPSMVGVDSALEMAISPILLGRFLFQLRNAASATDNVHGEENTLSDSRVLTTFQAAVRHVATTIEEAWGTFLLRTLEAAVTMEAQCLAL
ncbi:hypothetical protein M422DRAFT_246281 [Sphaerobolus stellatus SS14]|nr:hypothetical protein M422DRAFT_246281 [Sphaerobolus stellatus SS14]